MADDTVSTAVPATAVSDEDSDGLTTMRSDASRLSKARSHASRGSGRKKRDKDKYLAACKAKHEAEGNVFNIQSEDTFNNTQTSNMRQPSTHVDDGCTIVRKSERIGGYSQDLGSGRCKRYDHGGAHGCQALT